MSCFPGAFATWRPIRAALAALIGLMLTSSAVSAAETATPTTTDSTPRAGAPLLLDQVNGFEDGSIDDWAHQGASFQKKYVHDGAHAIRLTAKSKPAFIRRTLDKTQVEMSVQFSVRVLSHDDQPLTLTRVRTHDGKSSVALFSNKNGKISLQIGDQGPALIGDAVVADGDWHTVLVHVRDALSGVQKLSKNPIDTIEFGVVSGRPHFDAVYDGISVSGGAPKPEATVVRGNVRAKDVLTTPTAVVARDPNDSVLRWKPEIVKAATATGVPPSLIAGIMALESSGDPGSLSVAGAVGLMQVMPEELAAHGVAYADGFDPATNVMTGARILAERSGNGWELAAGYYFGIGCDAYKTCTADYVRVALSWAAFYAPALGDSFRGDPSLIPASWEMSAATDTPTPTATPTKTPTPADTPQPSETPTSAPSPSATPKATRAVEPTDTPTDVPTAAPVDIPTETETPVEIPTEQPTEIPTETPVDTPTDIPADTPTDVPADTPTDAPAADGSTVAG